MKQLILLYWGCVFLMYLSQTYYPVEPQLDGHQIGRRHFMLRRADIFMIIVIAWMTCFSFLRTSYNDTETYIKLFTEAQSLSEGWQNGSFTNWAKNPLYELYVSLVRTLTDNFHIFFIIPAFLSNIAFVKLCKRYSANPSFSLLIFFSIGTYVMYIAALKQSIAFTFLLLSVPYAINKKYGRFYLLVFLACMFHVYSILFAIFPIMIEKPWGSKTWLLLSVVIVAMITYDETLGRVIEYAESAGVDMKSEEIFFDHQLSVLRVLVYFMPGLIALVFRRRLFSDSSREENAFVDMSIFSAMVMMIGMVKGANLFSRMAGFFDFSSAIALPWMINKIFNKQSAKIVTIIAAGLYFVYFMYEFAISKDFSNGYAAISIFDFIVGLFK